jgi:hypothetical protein
MNTNPAAAFLGSAPKEVQDATLKANRAFNRVRKAMTQVELWKKEHGFADKEFQLAQAEQSELLQRWNPETNSITPKPEEAPTQAVS